VCTLFRLFQVVNDPDKAEAVALEADRLEEVAQKAVRHDHNSVGTTTGHTPVFVFTEAHLSAADVSTGVIVVSASTQTLGQIALRIQRSMQVRL